MARTKGMLNLSGNLEVNAGAPLDARSVVPTLADLTNASNFQYKYVGMTVVVQATGDMYVLTANDVTVAANWKQIGSGGGGTTYTAGDGIVIDNDEISTDNMPAADMAEIVTPLPSVMSRFPVYSEDEQMIAYWEEIVDGVRCRKPIYEKRYDITSPTASASLTVVATYDSTFSIIDTFGMVGGYPLSAYQGANYYIATIVTGGNIYIEQKNIAAGVPGYIFIRYTKSTDSWIPV